MNEQDIEQRWRAQSTEQPSGRVDAAIRAAARRELRRRPAWLRYAPLAAAASVGVIAILLVRQSPHEEPTRVAPIDVPTVPATSLTPLPPAAETPAVAPPPGAAPTVAPPARKIAPTPPAAEPARAEAQQRSAETRQASAEQRARDSAPAAIAAGAADIAYTNGEAPTLPARLVELITADAAAVAEVDPQDVEIVSWESVTWSDGSLGCRTRGEVAIQVLTPGYRVQVLAGGEPLVYHTDREGLVRLCSTVRSRAPR